MNGQFNMFIAPMLSILIFGLMLIPNILSAETKPDIPLDSAVKAETFRDSGGQLIYRDFLHHSKDKKKKIELFWAKPGSEGPWPAIIYIHGHQIKIRSGGKAYVVNGQLSRIAERGYVAAAISQPGYGNSDGPPDFCGPFTQEAVICAIEFLRQKPFIKSNKIGLYGISRGAIVASMVATKDPKLAVAVLVSGIYDLGKTYPKISRPGLIRNIDSETGSTTEAFKARSAIYHADEIKAAALLLHGVNDDIGSQEDAKILAQKIMANNVPVRIKIFPNVGHIIPTKRADREIYPFLREHLLKP